MLCFSMLACCMSKSCHPPAGHVRRMKKMGQRRKPSASQSVQCLYFNVKYNNMFTQVLFLDKTLTFTKVIYGKTNISLRY